MTSRLPSSVGLVLTAGFCFFASVGCAGFEGTASAPIGERERASVVEGRGGAAGLQAPEDACASLVGQCFRTSELHECGLGPRGVERCHWTLRLGTRELRWQHSDVEETGTYTCQPSSGEESDGTLEGRIDDRVFLGIYTVEGEALLWDGLAYRAGECRE